MRTHRLIAFALLSLAIVSPPVEAKRENAPGILKKVPLTLSNLVVNAFPDSVTITWTTNKPSDSSLAVAMTPMPPPPVGGFDGILYEPTLTTEHRMTWLSLSPDAPYAYEVISSDDYGYTVRDGGTFRTPSN